MFLRLACHITDLISNYRAKAHLSGRCRGHFNVLAMDSHWLVDNLTCMLGSYQMLLGRPIRMKKKPETRAVSLAAGI